jgi:cytochrome c556
MNWGGYIAALVLVAGCQTIDENAPLATAVKTTHARMQIRAEAARTMQEAIAVGDLDGAHTQAQLITALRDPDVLQEWRPYLDAVRTIAKGVASSSDTVAAAKAAGELGQRCGACHEASGARIKLAPIVAPSPGSTLATQMAGHQWAAARMWEGLTTPSTERWQTGVVALSRARWTIAAEEPSLTKSPISDDVARVRLLAERGLAAETPPARGAVYGELLATCAHCHATIRDTSPRALAP